MPKAKVSHLATNQAARFVGVKPHAVNKRHRQHPDLLPAIEEEGTRMYAVADLERWRLERQVREATYARAEAAEAVLRAARRWNARRAMHGAVDEATEQALVEAADRYEALVEAGAPR